MWLKVLLSAALDKSQSHISPKFHCSRVPIQPNAPSNEKQANPIWQFRGLRFHAKTFDFWERKIRWPKQKSFKNFMKFLITWTKKVWHLSLCCQRWNRLFRLRKCWITNSKCVHLLRSSAKKFEIASEHWPSRSKLGDKKKSFNNYTWTVFIKFPAFWSIVSNFVRQYK